MLLTQLWDIRSELSGCCVGMARVGQFPMDFLGLYIDWLKGRKREIPSVSPFLTVVVR